MDLTIARADFADPELLHFLAAHLAEMAPTGPAESQHALDAAALQSPDIRLWAAYLRGPPRALAGTIALAPLHPGHEELKSMRTKPVQRGAGIGSRLLFHVIADARSRGVRRVSLETGSMEFFAPARALYRRHGFVECPPFGDYTTDPNSIFMTLEIASSWQESAGHG